MKTSLRTTSRLICALLAAGSLLVSATAFAACGAGTVLAGTEESTPDADFFDNRNGTVTHLPTGLIWKRCAEGQIWNGTTCLGEATMLSWGEALQLSAQANFAGADDWRVPNRKELESIVEFCGHSPAINQSQFPPTPSARFWSSTTFVETPVHAWDVYFSDGYSGLSNKEQVLSAVRLVRTAPAGTLLLTQRLTFGATTALAVGSTQLVSVSSSAGLPVVLSSLTPEVCTVAGNVVSGRGDGICILAADQTGSAAVYPAPRVTASLAVGRRPQTISFTSVGPLAVGASASLAATASSGLPVLVTAQTPTVCAWTGSRVTGLSNGSCTLTGVQAGDASFLPAAPASLSIAVGTAGGSDNNGGGTSFSYTQNLSVGWHLLGNGLTTPIDVATRFGNATTVESVWKWLPERAAWAFYAPTLSAAQLQSFLAARSFQPLTEIRPGEAYWIRLRQGHDFGVQSGVPYVLGSSALVAGWNLVTSGEETTPAELNLALSSAPPGTGAAPQSFVSLWAWDAARSRWYFYSPALDAQGHLKDYNDQHGYLDFASEQKKIGKGSGFWIRK